MAKALEPATTPKVYNVTCTSADTNYTLTLENCKKFYVGMKSKKSDTTWLLALDGDGATFAFFGNEVYSEDNIFLKSLTMTFQSDTAGEVIQVIAWT
jgi:hypothetical protein